MKILITLIVSFLSLLFSSCKKEPDLPYTPQVQNPDSTAVSKEKIDILALGDSYTKGESVDWELNFPNQLKTVLLQGAYAVTGIRNIAQTGWRTDQLKNALFNQNADIKDSIFSIVTLLIGVNNQYQGGSIATYQKEFEELLQLALARAGGRRERVFVLSIPDYAYTPFGNGNAQISAGIDQFNTINRNITQQYGISYVDITDISRRGLQEPVFVANDGLHPSATQYKAWVSRLFPYVKSALK